MIRIGIIGCGAIAERHLKSLVHVRKNIQLCAAVDINKENAIAIKNRYNFNSIYLDYKKIYSMVDAVIICLPNFLHAQVSIDFLKRGISVLCEKPMAINENEAQLMISASDNSKGILYIANVARLYWVSKEVKHIIKTKKLGNVISIDAEQGSVFSWPSKSGFFFNKKMSGGGVLIDIGSHLLDLILWWIDGFPESLSYRDDSFGGVEADAEIEMSFAEDVSVSVKLSRLRNLNNKIIITCENGTIIVDPYNYNSFIFIDNYGSKNISHGPKNYLIDHYFEKMIDNFLDAILGLQDQKVNPREILPSIKLIEKCYNNATRFRYAWL
jgi:predicted dehydrogenase